VGVPDNRNFVASIAARYGRRLRRFLSVRLRNTADVPDLAQEVFLRLLRVEGYESIRSPEAYLFTIASHVRDVAEEFNRYNRRPLTIDDRELQQVTISGVYSSTDPASLINFLRSQSSIRVIETEKQVRVIRREAN
jgi:hypothetical protein